MKDVREFAGHIACDGDSRSEIVVPILVDGRVCMLLVEDTSFHTEKKCEMFGRSS